MLLHLFNPEHDEALAADTPYYTASRAARTLGRDLCLLPAWWAAEGDYVLLHDDYPRPRPDFSGRRLHYVYARELSGLPRGALSGIAPWGWDQAVVHRLRKAGLPQPELLPAEPVLQVIRRLGSRRAVPLLLADAVSCLPGTTGEARWCPTTAKALRAIDFYGRAMCKAPWSGSGRGVFTAEAGETNAEHLRRRIESLVRKQGGVEIEPFYERTADFALEFSFSETDGQTDYLGLSVFSTTPAGQYAGNRLPAAGERPPFMQTTAQTDCLEACIAHFRKALTRHLPAEARRHLRQAGIDMMVVRCQDGQLRFHPCVEANLRQTMGAVALRLRHLLPADKAGFFRIRPKSEPKAGEIRLTPEAREMEAVIVPD